MFISSSRKDMRMEGVPTGPHVCVIRASGGFSDGFFFQEVSVFHRLSNQVHIKQCDYVRVAIHNLHFNFLSFFFCFCSRIHKGSIK